MRRSVRVIIVNADEEYSAVIRADLLTLDGVQIVAEVDELALVEQAVRQFPAEILMVHLDPMPEIALPIAAELASTRPDLAVFVISASTDPQHILTAMRAGVREFITKPIDRELLASAIGKVAVAATTSQEVGTLVSVMGTIGGAGASMLAANLAVELASFATAKPVAVVDLDFRYGQLATMLDLQADYTIADLCDTPEQLDVPMVQRAMVKHATGVHLLARPNHFAQADQITAAHCASVLSSLQQMYEYVVVDGPVRFDPGGLAVLDLADINIFVMQLLVTSVRNVHRMFTGLRDGGYNLDRFRLVCNRAGQESGHLEVPQIEKTLGKKVAYEIPDDWKTVSSAINIGSPLSEIAPKSRVRAAIREIAQTIAHEQTGSPATKPEGKTGLLGRLFTAAT
ncbi:MAG: MinD/ParA family protein [Phycisphaerae bacterium]|nr:MinD/ParA family protein [Phycisphaerae bacterium]